MHRLLQLLITQPDLLVAHATAYAELAGADAQSAARQGQQAALWSAALMCCISMAGVLAGGAVMAWAILPEGAIRLPWILVATPCVPALGALVCLKMLKPRVPAILFSKVRAQIAADQHMLRNVGSP